MGEPVVVDSDVLIDASRCAAGAVEYLAQAESQHTLAISIITEMELVVGCRSKAELRATERFLGRFQRLTLSDGIAKMALELLRRYRPSHGLLIADALIAATAILLQAPLVTKNQRDYVFISGLTLLPYPSATQLQPQP